MHRTIGYISKRLIQVRQGEGRKVFLTFLYFFLVITAYYVIKPVSRSLVLGNLGSKMVPYVDLLSALIMGPMVTIFAWLVDRVPKRRLVSLTFGAVILCLGLFWKLLSLPNNQWVPAAFYVWVSIFSVLVVTLFWLVANDLYHAREAKRLFGFIGSGGILGGIVGSSIAAAGARVIGTEQLLLLSGVILLACWVVVEQLWRYTPAPVAVEPAPPGHPASPDLSTFGSVVKLLMRSRYLLLLVGLVGIAKIVSTLVYYQFNPFLEQMFPDTDTKTAFTGLFFGWMNVAAFIVQFFFTSWILRRMGLAVALLALPIGVLAGSAGLLFIPAFWLAASTELYDGSMNYSLQQTSKEVLYLPIDRSIRYKVKPFIDMVVFRFGKGIAAIIGIVWLDVLHVDARWLSYLTIPMIVGWILLAVQLRYDYIRTIREILQARATHRRSRELRACEQEQGRLIKAAAEPESFEERFERLVLSNPGRQKVILAGRAFMQDGSVSPGLQQLLDALAQYEERLGLDEGPNRVSASIERLKGCLQDVHEPMAHRRHAVKELVSRGDQEATDCLLGILMVEEEASMRHEVVRGLTKLRLRSRHGLEFPKWIIRRQIAKEALTCQRVAEIAAMYRRAPDAGRTPNDPVLQLLIILTEESVQQIFRLLSLIYRPEDMYLIYNQMQESDSYVRADALELLDNLIDPGLRKLVVPVLDENEFLERLSDRYDEPVPEGKDAYALLQYSVRDHHRWLSLVTICLIGRLRITPLFGELDWASTHPQPMVRLAAQAARHLAELPAAS